MNGPTNVVPESTADGVERLTAAPVDHSHVFTGSVHATPYNELALLGLDTNPIPAIVDQSE
jgi:hypothetical protein